MSGFSHFFGTFFIREQSVSQGSMVRRSRGPGKIFSFQAYGTVAFFNLASIFFSLSNLVCRYTMTRQVETSITTADNTSKSNDAIPTSSKKQVKECLRNLNFFLAFYFSEVSFSKELSRTLSRFQIPCGRSWSGVLVICDFENRSTRVFVVSAMRFMTPVGVHKLKENF